MGATGDVFQLVDEQVVRGQQVLNVYFYEQAAATAGNGAEQLVTSWIDQIMPGITGWQTDDVLHTSVYAKNLFNESEAYTELLSVSGTGGSSDIMTTFNAVGYQLIGDNAAVRDGAKRYAGIYEGAVTDGVITDPTQMGLLDDLADLLFAGLLVGLAPDVFLPVVVGRILEGGVYRLPTTQGEAVVSQVIDSLWNPEVTSQVSRKVGRGA